MKYKNIYDFIHNFPYVIVDNYNGLDIRLYNCNLEDYVKLNLKDIRDCMINNPELSDESVAYAVRSALSAYLSGFTTFKLDLSDEGGEACYAILASNDEFITDEERAFCIGHELGHIMCGHNDKPSESNVETGINVISDQDEELEADRYSVITLGNKMPTWDRIVEILKHFSDTKWGDMFKKYMDRGFEFNYSDTNKDKYRFDNPPKA